MLIMRSYLMNEVIFDNEVKMVGLVLFLIQ